MAGVHEEYSKRSCLRNRYGPHEKTRLQSKQQKFVDFFVLTPGRKVIEPKP